MITKRKLKEQNEKLKQQVNLYYSAYCEIKQKYENTIIYENQIKNLQTRLIYAYDFINKLKKELEKTQTK